MIEWLRNQPPDRIFIEDRDSAHTYGEVADRVDSRVVEGVEVIRPSLDIGSIIDLIAVMSSGTAVLVAPDRTVEAVETPPGTACVIYTSGTTGDPKGVRLTRSNWEAASQASVEHLGHGHEDTWLLAMPLHHVAGLGIVLRSAYAGGRVRLLRRFDPESFAGGLHSGVTMASVVPTMLLRALDADPGPYAGLRAVLVGGGAIPHDVLERAWDAGIPALPTYGMTETCGQVATLRPGSPKDKKADPLPGVEIRIGAGKRVELRAPMLSPGYLGEPDRPANSWYITGDLGELDDDGSVRILGRADELIISGGENVDPTEVAAVVEAHSAVDEALVVGVPSAEWGEVVGCVYEGGATIEDLEAWARARLPAHAIPRLWRRVAELPRTELGELDRLVGRLILEAEPS